ncbi:MAG: hypothetical protein A2992_05075 [Elusimicrobia bacterium RIFCSPLOWO2_01_FULL_59_12]|nr:MAG: hypothetical protein A2992_05075 [Elusimicrobia bacterium RIFCSPLOWO2_01_FULL_59_12]
MIEFEELKEKWELTVDKLPVSELIEILEQVRMESTRIHNLSEHLEEKKALFHRKSYLQYQAAYLEELIERKEAGRC